MTSISSTFNAAASYQALLLILFIWISVSLDAEEKEDKAKKRRIARSVEKQRKTPSKPLPDIGLRPK